MTVDEVRERAGSLEQEFKDALARVENTAGLEEVRVRFIARKGVVPALFDELRSIPPEGKKEAGRILNGLRMRLQSAFDERKEMLAAGRARDSNIDLTLPGRTLTPGHLHPITQMLREVRRIFVSLGFSVADGPEVEDDYHNFEALNFPPDHPARDMQDTFFIRDTVLLRTHTSPVQIRVMETTEPPIRVIMPGRVYRNEAISARSYCLFHQVEGLAVDRGITFAELKGTLATFARQLYGNDLRYRFRASFFPFTEPSAEMDISCFLCGGKGCRMCKGTGWLEILGCGMVDPNVFTAVGYDPEEYTGYAFGMGIERMAILLYGIEDIRMYFENDLRLLEQF